METKFFRSTEGGEKEWTESEMKVWEKKLKLHTVRHNATFVIFSSFSLHVSVTIDHPNFTKKKCNGMLTYRIENLREKVGIQDLLRTL
jgi:hypothetical protein